MKKITGLILSLMMAFSLAACNSGNGNGGSDGGGANPSPDSSAKPGEDKPKEVTLKIGLPGGYDVTQKEIIDGFAAANSHIKLQIDESPWGDFVQKITAQVAAGNPPDVWFQENAVILGYGHRGAAEDLRPYIERDIKKEDYSPLLFASETPQGIWGIPHGLNPATIMYNKKMFEEANIPFPSDDWTYEEMLDIAAKLSKDTNGDGKNDVFGIGVAPSITTGWFPWSKIYGGGILDETKTKAIVTDPKTIQALEVWAGVIKDGLAPSVSDYKAGGGHDAMFADNKLAMNMLQYSSQVKMNEKYPDLDYDVAKMPIGYDGNRVMPLVTNSWLIYSKSKPEVKEAAWEFLKYYMGEEAQDIIAKSGSAIPIKLSSTEQLKQDTTTRPQNKSAYVDGVNESGVTLDENHSWQEWRLAAQPIFQEIHELIKTPEEGAKEIQEKIQKVLDENK
ncbi:sugar ABC transporter substrate-binding protein [Paenibacillus sp. J2TS4]|uniref:ABC transporter substrate-binding protein n=1 Tax=Paenibacillus sp. J2TS4 TaxID=2807194 RepID=UPI001B066D5A|nr:sugar ABC transporter substrate-binding protein [Paenibacillus sp. J2TS4]GIP31851.1 ABC transporter substrate-binding protein [Paenibacillus sp. J2TS4]